MKEALGEDSAPDAKSDAKILKEFFSKVLPGYDGDRFYPSHMKKVVSWYNVLRQYASLDFEEPSEDGKDGEDTETKEGE